MPLSVWERQASLLLPAVYKLAIVSHLLKFCHRIFKLFCTLVTVASIKYYTFVILNSGRRHKSSCTENKDVSGTLLGSVISHFQNVRKWEMGNPAWQQQKDSNNVYSFLDFGKICLHNTLTPCLSVLFMARFRAFSCIFNKLSSHADPGDSPQTQQFSSSAKSSLLCGRLSLELNSFYNPVIYWFMYYVSTKRILLPLGMKCTV